MFPIAFSGKIAKVPKIPNNYGPILDANIYEEGQEVSGNPGNKADMLTMYVAVKRSNGTKKWVKKVLLQPKRNPSALSAGIMAMGQNEHRHVTYVTSLNDLGNMKWVRKEPEGKFEDEKGYRKRRTYQPQPGFPEVDPTSLPLGTKMIGRGGQLYEVKMRSGKRAVPVSWKYIKMTNSRPTYDNWYNQVINADKYLRSKRAVYVSKIRDENADEKTQKDGNNYSTRVCRKYLEKLLKGTCAFVVGCMRTNPNLNDKQFIIDDIAATMERLYNLHVNKGKNHKERLLRLALQDIMYEIILVDRQYLLRKSHASNEEFKKYFDFVTRNYKESLDAARFNAIYDFIDYVTTPVDQQGQNNANANIGSQIITTCINATYKEFEQLLTPELLSVHPAFSD